MPSLDVDRSATRSPILNERGALPPSCSLSSAHIKYALDNSQDNGVTLLLTKKNLTDVGVLAAEELATIGRKQPNDDSKVERISLGYNFLTTLPMEFALLSRLRYLILKSNSFTVFPDVLTLMPSLDTLDMSHNKIKRLPSQPGHLVNLRVFCLAKNRLNRLPVYISRFTKLSILDLTRNPIDWPPKHVLEHSDQSDDGTKTWIRNLQKWIENETTRTTNPLEERLNHNELESTLEASFQAWSSPSNLSASDGDFDAGVTPHARSFSIDSTLTTSSAAESDFEAPPYSFGQNDRPPPLRLGMLQSYSTETSPTKSIESYLPSPAESDTFFDADTMTFTQHARNGSYHNKSSKSNSGHLPGKKSMPDLRTAKISFNKIIPELPTNIPITSTPSKPKPHDDFVIPSPLSQRQDSGSSFASSSRLTKALYTKEVTSEPAPVSSMASERNSYFRRMSTLPSASISNSLPPALLCLMDTARSILFAVCQIYQTLEHYAIHAIDDRLATVLRKVLDPASVDMMHLINSLDRFDQISRKTSPPPLICRTVVESCKDTIAVFGKAVGVLSLQVKVIAAGDDVRYLRSMILQLYGAHAEITCAWQNMNSQLETLKPLLRTNKSYPTPSHNTLPPSSSSEFIGSPTPEMPFGHWEPPLSSSTLRSNQATNGRTARERRKAGSFSVKDVELGASMPSYDEPSVPLAKGLTSRVQGPMLRAANTANWTSRVTSVTISSIQPPSPMTGGSMTSGGSGSGSGGESSVTSHSRTGSQTSIPTSAPDSPLMPTHAPTISTDLPAASKAVDKEALHSIESAIEVAPLVWSMMADLLGDVLQPDVRDSLDRAKSLTKRLSTKIRSVQEGIADKMSLREDGLLFVKTVIHLSNVVRKHGDAQSSALRSNLFKLNNSTEQFAMLLSVSSFTPSSASKPFSPLMLHSSPSQTNLLSITEDRLPSIGGLSRSRSAQPAVPLSMKPLGAYPLSQDSPRSALPSQSFNIPFVRRTKGDSIADPG